jgi:nicotinate-nucleotide adenylyltransferase
MLRLALPPGDTLDEAEVRSSQSTYTVNTLKRLRQELGDSLPLVFLIGADQLLALDSWREWTSLFGLTHFGVAQRPGYPVSPTSLPPAVAQELAQRAGGAPELAASAAGRIAVFPMQPQDVSSTAIRKSIADGRLPRNAVPATVLNYIESKRLYRAT